MDGNVLRFSKCPRNSNSGSSVFIRVQELIELKIKRNRPKKYETKYEKKNGNPVKCSRATLLFTLECNINNIVNLTLLYILWCLDSSVDRFQR